MDPYVVVTNRQNAARTTAKENAGTTPVWNEIIDIDVQKMSDDISLRVMDENVGTNTEVGCCSIKLAAMCVQGGLESWWPIAFGSHGAGRIHLHGEWFASGSDPVSVSAAAMPGQQQTVMQQTIAMERAATGAKPKPPPTYSMPAYNYQAGTQQNAP